MSGFAAVMTATVVAAAGFVTTRCVGAGIVTAGIVTAESVTVESVVAGIVMESVVPGVMAMVPGVMAMVPASSVVGSFLSVEELLALDYLVLFVVIVMVVVLIVMLVEDVLGMLVGFRRVGLRIPSPHRCRQAGLGSGRRGGAESHSATEDQRDENRYCSLSDHVKLLDGDD
jgi:hypothetical protein